MLRFTTRINKMRLPLLVMTWAFMVGAAAELRCDPLTQYELNDQCCKMCEPGTSMTSLSTCLEPQCKECGENDYQDKYTTESKCIRQRYCDPNLNFQVPVHESKKKKTTCLCKLGFHCSSEICKTCLQHSTCGPGYEAQSKGNQTHDTVCQKCLVGTFSNETSWDGVCKKWTECGTGFHVKETGSDTSDSICEEDSRKHQIVIGVVCCAVIGLIVGALAFWLCKGKGRDAKGKVKGCVESCLGEEKEPQTEDKVLTATPADPADEESMLHEAPSSQEEERFVRTPEENEDELSQEMSTDVALLFTDRGNFVAQENGKTEKLSRQESQTPTITV